MGTRKEDADIRSLRMKAMGIVTDADVKAYRPRVAGETEGVPRNGGPDIMIAPPGGAPSAFDDGLVYAGSAEQLLRTVLRLQRKVDALGRVTGGCTSILQV